MVFIFMFICISAYCDLGNLVLLYFPSICFTSAYPLEVVHFATLHISSHTLCIVLVGGLSHIICIWQFTVSMVSAFSCHSCFMPYIFITLNPLYLLDLSNYSVCNLWISILLAYISTDLLVTFLVFIHMLAFQLFLRSCFHCIFHTILIFLSFSFVLVFCGLILILLIHSSSVSSAHLFSFQYWNDSIVLVCCGWTSHLVF